MPALSPVPGVMRIAFRGTANGQAVVNVFHVQCDAGALTASTLLTLVQNVRSPYEVNFIPRLQGAYSGDTVTGTDLLGEAGAEATAPLGGTPGSVSSTTPQSAACCITWKISRHYRGGHPRTYLGPIPSTAIESPTSLTSTYTAQVQTAATTFLTAVNALTPGGMPCRLVAVHRTRDGAQLGVPLISPITSAAVDTRIDSQRRRLGRDR